jgi:hypothetical protein
LENLKSPAGIDQNNDPVVAQFVKTYRNFDAAKLVLSLHSLQTSLDNRLQERSHAISFSVENKPSKLIYEFR